MRNADILAKPALILAVFIWGSSFIAMKHAVQFIPSGWIILSRMTIAAALFLLSMKYWRGVSYKAGDWKYLLIMSLCEPCLYFALEARALVFTTASFAAAINSLQPPLIALFAWLSLGERVSRWGIRGLAISIAGAVLLSFTSAESGYAPRPWLGNLLELGAMTASSIYVLVLRKISERYSALFLTALQAFLGAVFFIPFALAEPFPSHIPTSAGFAVIYLGVFVTLGGYFLYNWGVARTSASVASVYLNLVPVFAIILAYIVLGERLTGTQVVATALIVVGVLVSQMRTVSTLVRRMLKPQL